MWRLSALSTIKLLPIADTDDASETEFRSPFRYGGTNGTSSNTNISSSNTNNSNSELKEQ